MAAKDDTAITETEDAEMDSSPASVLLSMTSYMKRLSDRLDAFVTAHEPSKHPDYPSRAPPPPAKRPARDDPTLSEDEEVDKEEEQDTRAKVPLRCPRPRRPFWRQVFVCQSPLIMPPEDRG